jgi:hypothetical protein
MLSLVDSIVWQSTELPASRHVKTDNQYLRNKRKHLVEFPGARAICGISLATIHPRHWIMPSDTEKRCTNCWKKWQKLTSAL